MSDDKRNCGCREYRGISRRRFLGGAAGALTALSVPGWLPRVVYAASEDSSRDVLVQIFLRGGWDALSVVVPYQESNYYDLRPNLAVPAPGGGEGSALDLDGFFGFNPAMEPLLEAYQAGDLLPIHACGSLDPTRSHFDAMHAVEVGVPEPPESLFSGWLARHLMGTAPSVPDAVLRAIALGYSLPETLAQAPAALPVPDLDTFGFAGDPATELERRLALEEMYRAADDPLESSAEATFRTVDLLDQIDVAGYQPAGGAAYPEGQLGTALRSTAALIKADVGVEAVAIDVGGWDTHETQGPLDGFMAQLMAGLAQGLGAFHRDLFTGGQTNVVVTVLSEFGRNVFENGSAGTDHGHGSGMLVLGGGIAGGRVLADWPGLAPDQLYEGQDLAVTIDYRDVLTEILTERLGNPDWQSVFPDPDYQPVTHGVVG